MTDFSEFDKMKFGYLLHNQKADWFHAHLARLIQKADSNNIKLLEKAYPNEVRFYNWYTTIGQWIDNDEIEYKTKMKEAGVD